MREEGSCHECSWSLLLRLCHRYREQRDRPDLTNPETLQLYLETRFDQLKVQTNSHRTPSHEISSIDAMEASSAHSPSLICSAATPRTGPDNKNGVPVWLCWPTMACRAPYQSAQ